MVTQSEFEIPLSNKQRQKNNTQDQQMMIERKSGQTYHTTVNQEKLVTSLIKKSKRQFKNKVNIVVKYKTNKLSMSCPSKDRISWNQKANVI